MVGQEVSDDTLKNLANAIKLNTDPKLYPATEKIFYLMGLFENWGGGTLKIISETVKSGKPEPGFSFEDGLFRLKLFRE